MKKTVFNEKWIMYHKKEKTLENRDRLVYAAKNKNLNIRMESSSGGIFSLLAEKVIDLNGVIYGVENHIKEVSFIRIDSTKDIEKIRGSKYVRASNFKDILEYIKEDIKNCKKFLFAGTPCQVAAVRKLIENYNYSDGILVDLICHGVTMQNVYEKFIDYIEEKNNSHIMSMTFRDKSKGWHEQKWKAELADKRTLSDSDLDSYKKVYYTHYAHMEGCLKCSYTNLDRVGDITLGDFWGVEKVLPEMDDNKGVSLVILNTPKGIELFSEIKSECDYVKTEIDKAMQPQLKQVVTVNERERNLFLKEFNKYGYEYAVKIMFSRSIKDRIMRNIKIKLMGK